MHLLAGIEEGRPNHLPVDMPVENDGATRARLCGDFTRVLTGTTTARPEVIGPTAEGWRRYGPLYGEFAWGGRWWRARSRQR